MNDPLLTRYRPETWDEVIGHDIVVKSMRGAIERGTARTFLLTGPSGVGKTTLARVASTAAGCDPFNSIEIDAATHTGVDEVRSIQDLLKYHQFGGSKNRAVIVDECRDRSALMRAII